MNELDQAIEKKPTWQIVMRIVIAVICVIAFILGALAFKVGVFFNYMLVALIAAVLLVIGARLPYMIYKQVDWGFLTRPVSTLIRSYWLQIVTRISLYLLAASFVQIGVVKAQIPDDALMPIYVMTWGAAIILCIISLFPKKVGAKPMTIFSLFALVPMAFLMMDSLYPELSGEGAVTLQSPFVDDAYMFHAGHNTVVNYHVAHSSQKHALDIVVATESGKERDGPIDKLESYACYGAPLIAPTAGEIVRTVSDMPDQEIGSQDPKNPAGNHVVIQIAPEKYVLLAHMKQNSLVVSEGDQVMVGDKLGECGNSGNTTGPHLHLQVQRYPDLFAEGGFTYPIKFDKTIRIRGGKETAKDGLFYRRNDIMRPRD